MLCAPPMEVNVSLYRLMEGYRQDELGLSLRICVFQPCPRESSTQTRGTRERKRKEEREREREREREKERERVYSR